MVVELEHFDKNFVKNTRRRGPAGKHFKVFSPRYSPTFWMKNFAQRWTQFYSLFSFYLSLTNFISISTRILFQSQTPSVVNKIAECWYRWHQTFETKSPFVVLIKVNPKQNRNAKRREYATNWQLTLYHNAIINW